MSAYGQSNEHAGGGGPIRDSSSILERSNTVRSYAPSDDKSPLKPGVEGPQYGQSAKFTEDFGSTRAGSTIVGDTDREGGSEYGGPGREPSTLKKKGSIRKPSVRRSGSRSRRNSVGQVDSDNPRSAFFTPVPTNSNPTEILANRFSAWRRILKDFISYFRDVSSSYEAKSKNNSRLYSTLNNAIQPEMFLKNGGILETNVVLKEYHKSSMIAIEQARQVDTQIIAGLVTLRSDLSQKIKEIKGLSGDFKNSLEKEREGMRRAVTQLEEALSITEEASSLVSGKNDPYVVKLAVDRQLRRQLTEENYLHRAYLNLEGSGRELESIVVLEIQKAFESYVKIMRREGMELIDTAERLDTQTVQLPGDHEWTSFVERDPNFVDPTIAIRSFDDVEYPGYNNPSVTEVRAGLLERKSKYLKSYTPGWYCLSPSHLHEFKTPNRDHDLTPVMSLYLPDTTMGSHTPPGSSSHKFMLKGRQTGGMHRGHNWVFRAESHEAMMGFYEDIKKLIESSGAERSAFVASHSVRHARKESAASQKDARSSSSENGLDNDEADEVPYSAEQSQLVASTAGSVREVRPEGGRFPSDLAIDRVRAPMSATSGESDEAAVAGAGLMHQRRAAPGPHELSAEDLNATGGLLTTEDAERPRHHQRTSSAFSYDERHPVTSTLVKDEDFAPVLADVPPKVERTMGLDSDETPIEHTPVRRDSTNSWTRTTPSRKPTATYGLDPVTGQPDTSVVQNLEQPAVYSSNDRRPSHGMGQYSADTYEQPATAQLTHPFGQGSGTPTFGTQYDQPAQHAPTSYIEPSPFPHSTTRDGPVGAGAGAAAGFGGAKAFDYYKSKDHADSVAPVAPADKPTEPIYANGTSQPAFLANGSAAHSPAVANATTGSQEPTTTNLITPIVIPSSIQSPVTREAQISPLVTLKPEPQSTEVSDYVTSQTENPSNLPSTPTVASEAISPADASTTAVKGGPATGAITSGAIPTSAGPPAVQRTSTRAAVIPTPVAMNQTTSAGAPVLRPDPGVASEFPGTTPPVAQRTNSSFTISDLHVPGEFPKGR